MPKANRIVVALGAAIVLIFTAGLIQLFLLRFEAGDIYPPYSSLRSDPLGTRAFFESLEQIPGVTVGRHFSNPEKLPPPSATTLILAGMDQGMLAGPDPGIANLKRFVANGGRVVLMFTAVEPDRAVSADQTGDQPASPTETPAMEDNADTGASEIPQRDLAASWGYGLAIPARDRVATRARRDPTADSELPETIAWRSGLVLTPEHPDWRVLYRIDEYAVVMERRLGSGSILVGTDSYLVSNEALRNHRQSTLLVWMVGQRSRVIFDETHFGIRHRPGIATLMHRYRLHGLIAGLLLWAGLYIWRSSRPLLPPKPDGPDDGFRLAYQDTDRALVALIGRHLPENQLLATCVAIYEKSLARPTTETAARLDRIRRLADASGREPVQSYQKICQLLARRPPR